MKKSILALSAAVAVSGLGFAGAANALAIFDTAGATATSVQLAPSGVGHYLFAPYYSTQADNNTLLSVINTDTTNGKAVKVRFRGAANSDDVLDFTLFLSPGDVWTASLVQGANGFSEITTPDTSCTLPQTVVNVPFRAGRLDQTLSAEALAAHTREGYVEFLNMADVKPGTALFNNIKHKNGVAPCDRAAFNDVLSTEVVSADVAEQAGLTKPTGGLTGGWTIIRLANISTYSGLHTAVVAASGEAANGEPVSGSGAYAFAPQSDAFVTGVDVTEKSADPLFSAAAGAAAVAPLWMDLPDMSTPLTESTANAQAQALSEALAKGRLINEFVSTADGAVVPGDTDWVVSQPTRRYNIAYDYAGKKAVVNDAVTFYTTQNTKVVNKGDLGSFICLNASIGGSDREEGGIDAGDVQFSPSTIVENPYCGEVFTMSFHRATSQVLSASLTNVPNVGMSINKKNPEAGWAVFAPKGFAAGLPMTGFAAISLKDATNNGNYGYTFGHRW